MNRFKHHNGDGKPVQITIPIRSKSSKPLEYSLGLIHAKVSHEIPCMDKEAAMFKTDA
jgi:hypothetical protein